MFLAEEKLWEAEKEHKFKVNVLMLSTDHWVFWTTFVYFSQLKIASNKTKTQSWKLFNFFFHFLWQHWATGKFWRQSVETTKKSILKTNFYETQMFLQLPQEIKWPESQILCQNWMSFFWSHNIRCKPEPLQNLLDLWDLWQGKPRVQQRPFPKRFSS